jgi:short-chain fatty acids transporter
MISREKYELWFKRLLPSPFTIAIILSLITVSLALIFGESNGKSVGIADIALQWERGIWNNSLLVFTFQMMFMLVLGHALALSKPISGLIETITKYCTDTPKAALIVTFFTLIMGFMNWGLGLIFGAILARKVGEYAIQNGFKLHYPLVGAAGYSGLLIWHGGISGSSLIKISEPGHLKSLTSIEGANLPEAISISETVFSGFNIVVSITLLVVLSAAMWWMGKRVKSKSFELKGGVIQQEYGQEQEVHGAEKLNYSVILGVAIGFLVLVVAIYKIILFEGQFLGFVTPNFINLCLFGLALIFHKNFNNFLRSIESSIGGAAGILIQFPLYFGIMGIMIESNLVIQFSEFLVSQSTERTYPIFTFISAGIVNVFVPSGGGQWAIQGPIIVDSYLQSGIPLQKSILAMAYGDELTNMLQPFWALPLLGITGLKASEIIPYTLYLMTIAFIIFIGFLFFM